MMSEAPRHATVLRWGTSNFLPPLGQHHVSRPRLEKQWGDSCTGMLLPKVRFPWARVPPPPPFHSLARHLSLHACLACSGPDQLFTLYYDYTLSRTRTYAHVNTLSIVSRFLYFFPFLIVYRKYTYYIIITRIVHDNYTSSPPLRVNWIFILYFFYSHSPFLFLAIFFYSALYPKNLALFENNTLNSFGNSVYFF